MPVRPFLSRVLLSLALVLNAVAPAAASPHVPMGQVDAQAAPMAAHANPSPEGVPCDHHRHAAAAVAGDPTPATHAPDATGQVPSDCCTSGACSCACVHASHAALPAPAAGIGRIRHRLATGWLPLAHGTPALPNLIRPPIG